MKLYVPIREQSCLLSKAQGTERGRAWHRLHPDLCGKAGRASEYRLDSFHGNLTQLEEKIKIIHNLVESRLCKIFF